MTTVHDQRLALAFGTAEEAHDLFAMVVRHGRRVVGFDKLVANPDIAMQLINDRRVGLERIEQEAVVVETILDAVDNDQKGRALLSDNFAPDRLAQILDVHGKNHSMLHAQAPGFAIMLMLLGRLEESLRNSAGLSDVDYVAEGVAGDPREDDHEEDEDEADSKPSLDTEFVAEHNLTPKQVDQEMAPPVIPLFEANSSHESAFDKAVRIIRLDAEERPGLPPELLTKQLVVCLDTVLELIGRKDDRQVTARVGDWIDLLNWPLLAGTTTFGAVLALAIECAADADERIHLLYDLHIEEVGIEPVTRATGEGLLCYQESLRALREEVLQTAPTTADPGENVASDEPDQLSELLDGIEIDL